MEEMDSVINKICTPNPAVNTKYGDGSGGNNKKKENEKGKGKGRK